MKFIKFPLLFLMLLSFSACEIQQHIRTVSCVKGGDYDYLKNYLPGKICTSDTCAIYQSIWKSIFMEKNNLENAYFDNHIELVQSDISKWNDGISFSICYKVKLGWAIAYNCDQFIIKIEQNNQLYSTLNVPRGTYLSKEQIKLIVENHAFSSDITKLSNVENLKFNSMGSALNSLILKANGNTLCSGMIIINHLTGDLELEAGAQYDHEVNRCIKGKIDLITGDAIVAEGPCMID